MVLKGRELKTVERESTRSLDCVYLLPLCCFFSTCYLVPTSALQIMQQLHSKQTLENAVMIHILGRRLKSCGPVRKMVGGGKSGGKNKQTSWRNGEINLSETRKQRSEKQREVDKFF